MGENIEEICHASASDLSQSIKRAPFWDLLRGIGILLVLHFHAVGGWNYIAWDYYVPRTSLTFNSWFIFRCIITPTISVFIFISGYMVRAAKSYAGSNLIKYYLHRSKRIVLPFLLFSAVYTLAAKFVYGTEVTFVSFVLGTNGIHLYYLAVLIQLMLLTPFLTKLPSRKIMAIFCMAVVFANGAYQTVFWHKNHIMVENEMLLFTCWIGYYYLGFYMRNFADVQKLNARKFRLIFGTVSLFAYAFHLWYSYHLLDLTDNPTVAGSYNSLSNVIYSISVIFFLVSIKNSYRSEKIGKAIEWIGCRSIEFYGIHWLVMSPMETWCINNLSHDLMWVCNAGQVLLTFAICCVLVLLKSQIGKMIGKRSAE